MYLFIKWGFPGSSVVKNPPTKQEIQVRSLGQEDPVEKEMPTTPVFLPGKSHEKRSLAGYSPQGFKRVRHDLVTKQQLTKHLIRGYYALRRNWQKIKDCRIFNYHSIFLQIEENFCFSYPMLIIPQVENKQIFFKCINFITIF